MNTRPCASARAAASCSPLHADAALTMYSAAISRPRRGGQLAQLGELVAGLLLVGGYAHPDGAPVWHKQTLRAERALPVQDAQVSVMVSNRQSVMNNGG